MATAELVAELRDSLPDLPRLAVDNDKGGLDIRLEDGSGGQVRRGLVLIEGPEGAMAIPIDPSTRRFRRGGLAPGKYRVTASSAEYGRGQSTVVVRSGDVTRRNVPLDGVPISGTTRLTLAVKGASGDKVRVRVTDKITGREVFDGRRPVRGGNIEVEVPAGDLHIHVSDDSGATSCYDADASDDSILGHLGPFAVELAAPVIRDPNPPDPLRDPFPGLSPRYSDLKRLLPRIGIRSLTELAGVEGEDLMHRVKNLPAAEGWKMASPVLGGAILEARARLGAARISGEQMDRIVLHEGGSFQRSYLPSGPGEAQLRFELPESSSAEVLVSTARGKKRHTIQGSQTLSIPITEDDHVSGKPVTVRLISTFDKPMDVTVTARMPVGRFGEGVLLRPRATRDDIETIYRAWAVYNPGIDINVVETSLDPENIRGWLERARTYFSFAGVCSIDDLGTFRMDPLRVLRPGAFVAPQKPPVDPASVPALVHYAFSEVINNSVVYYRPNDTLHDTAVVMAGAWDIRGQTIVIGNDVRELVVIAGSILHDAGSAITWEEIPLPAAPNYFPEKAARGDNGSVPGERGHDGAPGDPDPHPAHNGGVNANVPAPIVTMYLLDATNNLPLIVLQGQDGGFGGRGQDGGDGGNGAQGEHADSHFFSGCCRGVGHGGDGGNAGDAGRGGQGGRGGPGGRLTVLTTDAGIGVMADNPPSVDVNAGAGGVGGGPGSPGNPGHGGPAGSADCELWCDEHPERHGNDGSPGSVGSWGRTGEAGPPPLSDALQVYPITAAQWDEVFNQPHILQVNPYDVEPGETVTITGQNFIPGTDKIFFDGVQQSDATATVSSSTSATFVVPLTAEGGTHPIVIRPAGVTTRRSNRVWVRVIPVLGAIPAGTRWLESDNPSLTGLALVAGVQILAEDWSIPGHPSFNLPVTSNDRTTANLQIPAAPLAALRGVRRIRARNPDGGTSRAERVVRISDTIVVPVAAFRVLGTTPGVGTERSASDIASLFTEGDPHSISVPWGQARISFRLVQTVGTITVADDDATVWPIQVLATDQAAMAAGPGLPGILNIFFVRDVQMATAYSYFGGGPIICGDNAGDLSIGHLQAIAAHEVGHSLCLRHVCDGAGEGPGTFFNRVCQSGDEANLMYPFWDTQTGLAIPAGQVDAARVGATHLEEGKTTLLAIASMFQTTVPAMLPLCQNADTE
jgi:hypothetical protein